MKELFFGRRYRATESIGAGGMADVYRAVDEVLGRTVAVKVMHARLAAEPSFAARFLQEAQAAANLASPNIAHVYDWGQDGDTYYIAMEYVRGSDLHSIIEQRGALPSRTVADIGAQVCCALSVAHGYDIVHRDIKPHNIMVQPDGTVKVMDFGIASTGTSTMTVTGSVLGTAQYLSPEQAQGLPVTAASDLYSLGVVLYEAVTGRLPFDADSPVAIALKHVNEQAVPPRVANPDVDPRLERVIATAMQKPVGGRYASADDLRRDLLPIALGATVSVATGHAGVGLAGGAAVASGETETAVLATPRRTAIMPPTSDPSDGGCDKPRGPRTIAHQRVWPWVSAAVLLVAAGFFVAWTAGSLGSQSPVSPEVPEARAVRQITPPEQQAAQVAPIPIPDLLGMSEADAGAALETAGFRPDASPPEFDSDAPLGTVYSQTPPGDATALPGSVVTYAISRGAEPVAPSFDRKRDKANNGRRH